MKTKNQNSVRRYTAFLFTVIIILASLSCFPSAVAAETITIKNIEPAILASVGDTLTLGNYKVEFSDGTVSDGIKWEHNGSEITSFNVTEAKVYPLVASSGGKTQNIYIVAKKSSDSEYVLYSNDFASENALNDWNRIVATDGVYTVGSGKLEINGLKGNNPRIYLPAWLSDFGNYRIDTVGTQTEATDTSRWFSVIYRARNAATTGVPYYHMAVRNNMATPATATTGGIECCSYTGGWTYYKAASYTESVNASKNYTFSVLVKDRTVQYQVNGDVVLHLDYLPSIAENKGGIGLQANSSKFIVDSIRVSIQQDTPEYTEPEIKHTLQFVSEPETNILNTPTNIAIVDSVETLNGLQEGTKPSNALMYIDSSLNVNKKDGTNITTVQNALEYLGKSIIPAFYIDDRGTADSLIQLLRSEEIKDVLIVSSDAAVAKYAREKYSIARNAVFFSAYSELPTEEKLLEMRGTVTGAKSLIAIIPIEYAVTEYVDYLQVLGITVWIMNDNVTNDTEIARMLTSGANGLITNDYKKTAASFTSLFNENTLTRTPVIIGHRGNPSQAPENSISGFLKAVENGAYVVETDIKITKDGHVVIMHDGTLTRTTTYTGSADVSQMTLEEIKQYYLWDENDQFKYSHPDERVPTFEEMLIALKDIDCKIFLEIKTGEPRILRPTVDLIKEYGYEDRIFVICFNSEQLITLRSLMPEMGTGFLCMTISYTSSTEQLHDMLYNNLLLVQACNSTLNPNYGNLSKEFIAALKHRGITCWPWTYSTGAAAAFNNAFLWGVDGITTDDAQYSKNMVMKLDGSDKIINIKQDETATITADKVNYGGTSISILEDNNTFIKFIDGEDVFSYENGTITGLKTGTASFMIGYKARTALGSPYVLYTQPYTVTVTAEGDNVSEEETKNSSTARTVIIVGAALLLVLGAVIIFTRKKGK